MEPPLPPPPPRPVEIAPLASGRGAAVVRLREPGGGGDQGAVPSLRGSLDQAIETGAGLIVIDLTGVTFVDSTMLGELLVATRHTRRNGTPARIAADDPHVWRILELTLLDRVLALYPSVELALDGGGASV